jgi:hypothetical protein
MWIKDVLKGRFEKWLEEANVNITHGTVYTTTVDGYTMTVKVVKT